VCLHPRSAPTYPSKPDSCFLQPSCMPSDSEQRIGRNSSHSSRSSRELTTGATRRKRKSNPTTPSMPGNGHRPGKINTTGVKVAREDALPRDVTPPPPPPPPVAEAPAPAPTEAAAPAHAASNAPALKAPPAPGGSESIRVVVRIRPLNKKELANGEDGAIVSRSIFRHCSFLAHFSTTFKNPERHYV